MTLLVSSFSQTSGDRLLTIFVAAGGDADAFADEDEEGGRMFGGGLNEDQKVILDMCASSPLPWSSRSLGR